MSVSRKAPKVTVEVEGFDILPNVDVLSVTKSLGGARTDTATFVINNTPRHNFLLRDCNISDLVRVWAGENRNPIVKISVDTRDGHPHIIHRGAFVMANYELGPSGERVTCTSRTDWHLLQDSFEGGSEQELAVSSRMSVESHLPWGAHNRGWIPRGKIVFNPYVDGVSLPNRGLCDPIVEGGYLRNKTVAELRTDPWLMSYWTLSGIVEYIIRTYNLGAKFISNIEHVDSLYDVIDDGENLVRNLELDFTRPITETLDQALDPYGYSWFIDHNHPTGNTVFKFVDRRTDEEPRVLCMPEYGERVHSGPAPTTAKSLSLQYDVSSNSANQFYVIHGGTVVESTWYLYPAWDPEHDFVEPDALVESDENVEVAPALKRVFRDWVLNESGEYDPLIAKRIGIETGEGAKQVRDAFDNAKGMAKAAEVEPQQRRVFLPMLTLDDDGSPKGSSRGGVEVEYWTKENAEWRPISDILPNDGAVSVLAGECGIRFNSGERPPEEMFALRDGGIDPNDPTTMGNAWWTRVKFRVTASIQGNDVVRAMIDRPHAAGESFLSEPKPYYIDNTNVRSSVVAEKGKYYGMGDAVKAAEVDMQADADAECERAANVYGMAACAGTITLEGIEQGDQYLGATIQGMVLRNVEFLVSPPALPPRYPMVVAVAYDLQQQEVSLTLDIDRLARARRRGRRETVGWKRQAEVMDLRR